MSDAPVEIEVIAPSVPAVPDRCGRCGYVTKGLQGTTCPECAFDLTRSAYLRFADRGWLRTIVLGTHLLRVGGIGLIAVMFGGRTAIRATLDVLDLPAPSDRMIGRIMMLVFLAVSVTGAWLFTSDDPTFAGLDDERSRRGLAARIGIGLAALFAAARIVLDAVAPPLVNAGLIVVTILCLVQVTTALNGVVRSLLLRSEATSAEDLEETGKSQRSSGWIIGAVALVALLSIRGGLAGLPSKVEGVGLGVGVLIIGFAFVRLVKSSRAIRQELERA